MVALVWQWQWARLLGTDLTISRWLILGLGVWSIYLLDRVFDAQRETVPIRFSGRHALASRRGTVLSTIGIIAALVGLWLALTELSGREQLVGFALAGITTGYFLIVHLQRQLSTRWHAKEIAVGIIFAIGTGFFPLMQHDSIPMFVPFALLTLAGLLTANAILITVWESDQPRRQGVWLGFGLVLLVSGLGWWLTSALVWPALGLAACLHVLLDATRGQLDTDDRRAIVDGCLLTPLLFW